MRPFRAERWVSLTRTRTTTSANEPRLSRWPASGRRLPDVSCAQARILIPFLSLTAPTGRYVGVESTLEAQRRDWSRGGLVARRRVGRMVAPRARSECEGEQANGLSTVPTRAPLPRLCMRGHPFEYGKRWDACIPIPFKGWEFPRLSLNISSGCVATNVATPGDEHERTQPLTSSNPGNQHHQTRSNAIRRKAQVFRLSPIPAYPLKLWEQWAP
jgi:hypothetical protein